MPRSKLDRPALSRPAVRDGHLGSPWAGPDHRFSTRQDGTSSVVLAPGPKTFVPDAQAGGFPHAGAADVTVQAGTFSTLDFVYDTGLR